MIILTVSFICCTWSDSAPHALGLLWTSPLQTEIIKFFQGIFFLFSTAPVGQGLIVEVSRTHSDTTHSLVLLWTSDQPESRELYLTTHNTHNRQIYVLPTGFEQAVPTIYRRYRYDLYRSVTVIGTVQVQKLWKGILIFPHNLRGTYYFECFSYPERHREPSDFLHSGQRVSLGSNAARTWRWLPIRVPRLSMRTSTNTQCLLGMLRFFPFLIVYLVLTLRRRIKSHLLFAGIIRSSPFSPR